MPVQDKTGLCRNCGGDISPAHTTCPQCTSHKFLFHPELHQLLIAHIDCDAFFASVEKRDNPDLLDKPVIIGGGKRGVVAAACYQARIYKVHSAMPMFKALKACPQAVVIKPDIAKYAREGQKIKELMRSLTPLVEPLSIDEAFVDLTGTERLHGCSPAASLIRLQNKIRVEMGLTVSVGLSYNKFLAKTASDLDKPNGFAILGRAEALDFLADKPIGFIFGVGPAFARSLKKQGILTIKDVRRRSDSQMAKAFGDAGLRLARLARAEDTRPVNPVSVRKSISSEMTFDRDIGDEEELCRRLWLVCVKTSDRAKTKNLAGRVITLKLSIKQLERDPGTSMAASRGKTVTCTVTEVNKGGIEVKFGEDGEEMTAFIRKGDLSRERSEQRPERFAVGDKVDAKILKTDRRTGQVTLSIKALEIEEEKAAVAQYGSTDSGASLGDILGAALKDE